MRERRVGVYEVPPPSIPEDPRLLVHHAWCYDEPTACGVSPDRRPCSSVSAWKVQCRDCLAALGVKVDDRTEVQKERDLAGALWRGLFP